MKWENKLTQLLKIKFPVIQAPMLGVTTPQMVAAISNHGGLGSLPVGSLSPARTVELIHQTKALTKAPFAVNLFAHAIPEPDKQVFEKMQEFLKKICYENHFAFEKQTMESLRFHSYSEQIEILLNEHIPVVSFTFGVPNDDAIKAFKERGVILIGTATCLREAEILSEAGIDSITAQGIEAGGHRGTFLKNVPLPLIGLMSLIPQLASHIHEPIIAAGGLNDGRTIKASFMLGAKGVQIGTAFVGSEESLAIPSYKTMLPNMKDTDSILTKSFSGRWARGLKNKFITLVESSGLEIPQFPFQGSLTSIIRTAAQQSDDKEFTSLWAGQSAFKTHVKPAAGIFTDLVRQTEELDDRTDL